MFNLNKNVIFLSISLLAIPVCAQETKTIKLPAPQKEIGKPLMEVLNLRHSSRAFSSTPLPQQELSNLLWAAFGINRPESGKRTAPSARNWQEVDVYVTTAEGAFLYDAKENALKQVIAEDVRALTGTQDYVKSAGLNLVFVADQSKYGDATAEDKMMYSGADVGFIAENAYLYCTSQGLAVVVRAMIKREELSKKLNLKPEQKIVLAQTIGYPAK